MDYKIAQGDLMVLVSETLEEFSPALKERNIDYEIIVPPFSLVLQFDFFRIGQVVRNLVSNALKFSEGGDKITIHFEKTNEIQGRIPLVRINVKDQGKGIPEKELSLIFDKFMQSSMTDSGAGGTGLGLAICREIVSAHGGNIFAMNNKQKGATFSFTLPMTEISSITKRKAGMSE